MASFSELGIPSEVEYQIRSTYFGFEEPTSIQRRGIPSILDGYNVCLLAETGSGKTVAYALPILERMRRMLRGEHGEKRRRHKPLPRSLSRQLSAPRCLILCPTAELCTQVATVVGVLTECFAEASREHPSFTFEPILIRLLSGKMKKPKEPSKKKKRYGKALIGVPITPSMSEEDAATMLLLQRAHVVISTPGRALAEFRAGRMHFGMLEFFVVDEVDEFVSAGFLKTLEEISSAVTRRSFGPRFPPPQSLDEALQVIFVGATLSRHDWDEGIKKVYPHRIKRVVTEGLHLVSPKIEQRLVYVSSEDARKRELCSQLDERRELQTIVFVESTEKCEELAEFLNSNGHVARAYHGRARQAVLDEFWAGEFSIMVSTDLGARGLDFPNVRHIVQYSLPESPERYLHRMGRTARAGQDPPFYATVLINSEQDDPDMMEVALRGKNQDANNPRSLISTKRNPT